MSNIIPFSFEQHAVRTIERDGQIWFAAADVCAVLSIKNHRDSIRHLDDDERGVVSTDTPARNQHGPIDGLFEQLAVVNESGLYALVLRSRKPEARRFTKWITAEVLPAIRKTGQYTAPAKRQPKPLPNGLTLDQQDAIKGLVKARVEELPEAKRAKATITCWSALKSKFGCTYKEIEPAQFTEAVSLVARLPLEGELLEAEPAPRLALDFPVSRWFADSPHFLAPQGSDLRVTADMLYGMDVRSPTLQLLGELRRAGYNVEACRLEVQGLRHHLEESHRYLRNLQHSGDNLLHRGVGFLVTNA